MILGILQCDDVRPELQAKYGNYPQMFISLFESVGVTIQFKVYRVIDGQYPESIDRCDAYITTGSRFGVNDDADWIRRFEQFVVELYLANKRFIGICFGHQMMAKALGGQIKPSEKGWGIGVNKAQIVLPQAWMSADLNEISLVVSHQEQVVKLPEDAVILAGSEFCPFYMMQIKQHFLGIQGHPEFSKEYVRALMDARRDCIPAQQITAGIESLSMPVDAALVSRWLVNFLIQTRAGGHL
ncbi:GMP synthase - glutamine amidotransferase domain [Shewanella halifaxensis HAW-EB4]|uniref:GMP synthase-glutamine amidotransferase domain n=1 Tax=Shewanella halifaxensis (strain HAW-EB4) TaxID=458817 RepID=B0TJ09_SHEHH|nr:GMP synthase [Shewanella halifaxensis]ABZ78412.1 GMP synthase - glutamine amidotransferase domain [Shewanella halifaxensis HAW-EB4]